MSARYSELEMVNLILVYYLICILWLCILSPSEIIAFESVLLNCCSESRVHLDSLALSIGLYVNFF